MSANIEQIKAMLERAGKTNLLQKQTVGLDKERTQLEAAVNIEKIDKNLEEAAEEYADKHGFRVPYDGTDNFYDDADVKASKEGFIAGAKWQEKRDEETIKTAEDHAFLAGADWQYQKIHGELHKIKAEAWGEGFNTHDQLVMKEAVEANVADLNGDIYNYCLEKGMTDGDKVKLIIVKED